MKKLFILFVSLLAAPFLSATEAQRKILQEKAGITLNDLSAKGRTALKQLSGDAKPIEVLRTASVKGNVYSEDPWPWSPHYYAGFKYRQPIRQKIEAALAKAEEEETKAQSSAQPAGATEQQPDAEQKNASIKSKIAHYSGAALMVLSTLRLLYVTTRSTRKRAIAQFALNKFFSTDFAYQVSLMSPMDQLVIARAQKRILWCIGGILAGGGLMIAGRYV